MGNSNEEFGVDVNRRAVPDVPPGENIVISDFPSVEDRLNELGIGEVPYVAVLPRNFETASDAKALILESSASELRILGRKAGVDVETFARFGAREIQENDIFTIVGIVWMSSQALKNAAPIVKLLQSIVDFAKSRSTTREKSEIELELVQEFVVGNGRESKRLTYKGPASKLVDIIPTLQASLRRNEDHGGVSSPELNNGQ